MRFSNSGFFRESLGLRILMNCGNKIFQFLVNSQRYWQISIHFPHVIRWKCRLSSYYNVESEDFPQSDTWKVWSLVISVAYAKLFSQQAVNLQDHKILDLCFPSNCYFGAGKWKDSSFSLSAYYTTESNYTAEKNWPCKMGFCFVLIACKTSKP